MDILNKLRGLESRVTKTVNEAAQKMARSSPREPLEILHAIVDAVEKQAEPAGRGKYVFPFNRICITVAAESPAHQARFEAVFASEPNLERRIDDVLHAADCRSEDVSVETAYVPDCEGGWKIDFDRVQPAPRESITGAPNLRLFTIQGVTGQTTYLFAATRINLGRCAEVRDNRNRLIRTNHVAFAESSADPNSSVSRQHAHIDYAPDTADYRLCDDRSAHGTSVLRNGSTISVPSGTRGIRLLSGDEISLGEARLRIEIGS
jgi:hypothetical protein